MGKRLNRQRQYTPLENSPLHLGGFQLKLGITIYPSGVAMFNGMSAKTAALLGVAAGLALSATVGEKPLVQFGLNVSFPNAEKIHQSSEFGESEQRFFGDSSGVNQRETYRKKSPCPFSDLRD
jgi:hypothetical protein